MPRSILRWRGWRTTWRPSWTGAMLMESWSSSPMSSLSWQSTSRWWHSTTSTKRSPKVWRSSSCGSMRGWSPTASPTRLSPTRNSSWMRQQCRLLTTSKKLWAKSRKIHVFSKVYLKSIYDKIEEFENSSIFYKQTAFDIIEYLSWIKSRYIICRLKDLFLLHFNSWYH